jgi:hypothetical protein
MGGGAGSGDGGRAGHGGSGAGSAFLGLVRARIRAAEIPGLRMAT